MIIIADNSPISVLLSIDCVFILPQLFGKIYVTPQVVQEMKNYTTYAEATAQLLQEPWIEVIAPQDNDFVIALQKTLDLGEASSIALAKELQADLLLIDERKGRNVAQNLGINITGAIGVLLRAKLQGLIPSLKDKLDLAKVNNTFRFSDKIYQEVLKQASEI